MNICFDITFNIFSQSDSWVPIQQNASFQVGLFVFP